ncbi:MAG: peptide chain release factor N(5)-glutamine methyltransferase [Sphingobacteriia bacterium]|nr:peptide chain release factor N(5)-glutamine methyltransferase [Sphingobacteriia bacterium]
MTVPRSIDIEKIKKEYFQKIDSLELELLLGKVLNRSREQIISHPELKLGPTRLTRLKEYLQRRIMGEPLAYILGQKEFYGLNFAVNPHTLIPRPETELMVDLALDFIKTKKYGNNETLKQKGSRVIGHQSSVINIIDIGTGSGNIIISILKNLSIDSKLKIQNSKFFAVDISKEAIKIAKKNAKLNKINNIRFLHGNLLDPVLKSKVVNHKSSFLILANLPYLSKEIHSACAVNVKKYEPKSALYSAKQGLAHYEKLLAQILKLKNTHPSLPIVCFMEISPEQKKIITLLIKKYLPRSKPQFKKDLAQKWRTVYIEI